MRVLYQALLARYAHLQFTYLMLFFTEFYCLKYGIIYYVTIPAMYLLLVIFSIFNLNDVSWGTREVAEDQVAATIIILYHVSH